MTTRDGGPNPFHTQGFVTSPLYADVRDAMLAAYGGAVVADPVSPIIAGPFGTVASPVRVGANTAYDPTGGGTAVLTDNGRPMTLVFAEDGERLGRAVVIGDEEIFLNGPAPFSAELHGTRPNNQLLFNNIIDYLLGAPGLADGDPGEFMHCVTTEARRLVGEGKLTPAVAGRIISEAARAGLGRSGQRPALRVRRGPPPSPPTDWSEKR